MRKEKIYQTFSEIPTLTTRRLTLRQMHPMDAEDMFDYARRADVTRFLLWSPHTSLEYTRDYLEYIQNRYELGDFYDWALVERESGRMIGTCGFARIDAPNNSCELGYVINPDFASRGYATEAAECVIEFAFSSLALHRVEARFMKGNDASLAVMKKLGMTFEGYHTDAIFVKGSYRTVGFCAITEDEFVKSKQKMG